METAIEADTAEAGAMEWVRLLAEEVGPRRPTGAGERRAAELVAAGLAKRGLSPEQRSFSGYPTFALPYGFALAVALAGLPIARRRPLAAAALAAAGAALTSAEDGLVNRPLTRAFARHASQNVAATIEPHGGAGRTACLVCHLDASRSGVMFDRRFLPFLHAWIAAQAAAFGVAVAAPLWRRRRWGRRALAAGYGVLIGGLALLSERELRGNDVPGANDNASGVAAVITLALELHANPLQETRVICLFTGCEEAGVLGADAFVQELEADPATADWRTWSFINFDGVAAPATLRFLRREGVLRKWHADDHLTRIASEISSRRPELGLHGTDRNAGLTYDATPVMARGGRAITFSTQDGTIPNYHSMTDIVENLDAGALSRAVEVGREMLAAIDRGEAD
ncbi:MAG TPA: M28 family peptidase [Solirubrobacterales bacterium]|nr:M28 family peptidase [Solirubrobacterales bacterium]